jgi:preprotein translocase subunit YajC
MHLIPFAVLLAKTTTTKSSSASSLLPLLFFIAIGFILWRFYLKPRTQQAQNQRSAMSMLDIGDEVLTTSGIFGTIISLEADRATLETGPGTQLTVVRSAIARRVEAPAADVGSDLGSDLDDEDHDAHDYDDHDHEPADDADDDVHAGGDDAHDHESAGPETNGSTPPEAFDPFEGAVPKRRRRGSRRPAGGNPAQGSPGADDAGSGDASS